MNGAATYSASRRRTRLTRLWASTLTAAALFLCACGSGEGDVAFEVWGEEFVEDKIPSDAFADGWRVEYNEFLIVLGNTQVRDGGTLGGELSQPTLYDLTARGPHALGELTGLPTGSWPEVSYETLVADQTTVLHASANPEDLERLRAGEFSLYVSGIASKAQQRKSFAWGFGGATRYEDCVDVRDGQQTQGLVIGDGTRVTHQLTIHGDHLFYDDLASADAVLRFDALARADADQDDEVTLAELDRVSLSALPEGAGSYGVGAFDVDTLGQFVRAAVQGLGHFDGEGHCSARSR